MCWTTQFRWSSSLCGGLDLDDEKEFPHWPLKSKIKVVEYLNNNNNIIHLKTLANHPPIHSFNPALGNSNRSTHYNAHLCQKLKAPWTHSGVVAVASGVWSSD